MATVRGTTMDSKPLLRLLHLVSPTLPTGAFSYSQGLEWAVEAGWINDGSTLQEWLTDLTCQSMAFVDIPILRRMYAACEQQQQEDFEHWCSLLLACRESSELRQEEQNRGRAMASLLLSLGVPLAQSWNQPLNRCQLAGFALAAVSWKIGLRDAALGYMWSWLENQVLAGIKIIPLGQTEGQQILFRLGVLIAETVDQGLDIEDKDIGAASPALALACSRHENQYTRLYRS